MNESQAIESNATQLVCAQCGSRLSDAQGIEYVIGDLATPEGIETAVSGAEDDRALRGRQDGQ